MQVDLATFAWGLGAFAAALVAHVIWWRVRRPRADIAAVLAVFVGVPAAGLAGAALAGALAPGVVPLALLLAWALGAAYVQTYPATQAESPTLVMVRALAAAGAQGLSRDEIARLWPRSALVEARVDDLVANRWLARAPGGGLALAPAARILAACFRAYRRLLGLPVRGG